MAKRRYRQPRILDKISIHANTGSKAIKQKPKGFNVVSINLKTGESLKCILCNTIIRRSRGHRKAYIITRKGYTSIYSCLCYNCKEESLRN